MADSNPTEEAYSTVPVSTPTILPEAEDLNMNGFAWSADFGLLVAFGDRGVEAVDELTKLREPVETYLDFEQNVNEGELGQ